MRLLCIVASTDPSAGGVIEAIRQRGKCMIEMGHEVEIASLDSPDAPWIPASSLPIHACGPGKTAYRYSRQFGPWMLEHAGEYDAVIVDGLWQYGSFAARKMMRRLGKPYYVFTHGMLDPWFKRTYPLKHLKKMLYWPWAEYRVLRDAEGVCFTCEAERQLARQSFGLYKCNEIVVNLGISIPAGRREEQKKAFLNSYPELIGKRILLFLGRIHPKKGCDLLIDAFARVAASHPSLHLVLAGPDQTGWKERLCGQARRAGIVGRITWTGMLEGDAKWGAFHSAEAFVLPSHQENFGIAVAEALAARVPVLITNKVNIWREIEQDGAGFVASDTPAGIHELLCRWLGLDDVQRSAMAEQAGATFSNRFEIQRSAQSLLNVIFPREMAIL